MRALLALGVALCTCAGAIAPAQVLAQIFTGFPPTNTPLAGTEWLPADTIYGPQRFQTDQMSARTYASGISENLLIGGDAGQNLWQRGVVGPTVTTTLSYGPDRWAYWSTAASPVVVSKSALGLPAGFEASFQMDRPSGSTGTDQMCLGQEVWTQTSVQTAGRIVEFDFGVVTGSTFSGAGLSLYVVSGTGTNQGIKAMAFGINSQGGGTVAWSGQSNIVNTYSGMTTGTAYHPVMVMQMPTGTSEVGVAICWVPSGTAGTDDAIYLTGLQLRVAPYMVYWARQTGSAWDASRAQAPMFDRRPVELENLMQWSYLVVLNEGTGPTPITDCAEAGSTSTNCVVRLPVRMLQVPTISYVAGFATERTSGALQACTGLATVNVPSRRIVQVICTTGNPTPTSGFLYENGGSGVFMADGELY